MRLLLIKPPIAGRESEVHGELFHHNLHVWDWSMQFEAISYTWRRYDTWRCDQRNIDLSIPVPKDEKIFLGDSVLKVTANCVAALKRVRRVTPRRTDIPRGTGG